MAGASDLWQSSRISSLRCILRKWEKQSKTHAEAKAESAKETLFFAWMVGSRQRQGNIEGGLFAHEREGMTIATADIVDASERDIVSISGRDYIIESVQFSPDRGQMMNMRRPGGLTYITLRG